MATELTWADWATSIVTGGVVIGVGLTSTLVWVKYGHELQGHTPLVQASFAWRNDVIAAELVVRNRIPELLEILTASVIRPKGMTLRLANRGAGQSVSTSSHVNISAVIEACADRPIAEEEVGAKGALVLPLILIPPPRWSGGPIKLELRVASRKDTLMLVRKIVKGRVRAPSRL